MSFMANRHTPEGGRSLQKLFEAVARSWCSGQYDITGIGVLDVSSADAFSVLSNGFVRRAQAVGMSLSSRREDRLPQPWRKLSIWTRSLRLSLSGCRGIARLPNSSFRASGSRCIRSTRSRISTTGGC